MITILHPTSFSDEEAGAFQTALAMALAAGGRLVLVHVYDVGDQQSRDPDWSQFPRVREQLCDWGRIEFALPAHLLREKTGISVQKLPLAGRDPVTAMAAFLERSQADLVVMATRGSGLPQWIQPSRAASLAGIIRQPLMFVRNGIRAPCDTAGSLSIDNILVPVDDDPDPQLAVDTAGKLASGLRIAPRIRALHAGECPLRFPLAPPDGHRPMFVSDWNAGDPADSIVQAVNAMPADLVVMTRAGPSSVLEKLVGSTTTKIIARCDCPVLAVPAPGYA